MHSGGVKYFWGAYARVIALTFFLCVNIGIWSAVLRADAHGELTVAFLDVGQGDAIYIEAPNGNQMLIDGGPSASVLRALGRVMPFYDRSIDVALATHSDMDHVGGLPEVLKRLRVGYVVTTDNTSETGAYGEFENQISQKDIPRTLAKGGTKIILGDGVELEILFPETSVLGWDTNTSSIVVRLTYGNESFLFTGDSPAVIEKYLVGRYGADLKVNVIKLGHHGSRTSSSEEFLSATDPEYAIVSAGKDNKYGHPHKEVLDRLKDFEIPVLSTMEQGTIILKTDGESLVK